MAVPVRLELLAAVDGLGARAVRAAVAGVGARGQRLRDLGRALPRAETLTQGAAQRLDLWGGRLGAALGMAAAKKRQVFEARAGLVRPELLLGLVAHRRRDLGERTRGLEIALERRRERVAARVDVLGERLRPALVRVIGEAERTARRGREALVPLAARLEAAPLARFRALEQRLEALDRTRATLGYAETLRRGYAVVRGDGAVVTSKAGAEKALALEIEFADGRLVLGGKARAKKADGGPEQGSLF
jgi:exodeoxyribonuclease VII large subunit